ncbi:hypothetical protein UT300005_14510 [Clostridium sp. CTA-5]
MLRRNATIAGIMAVVLSTSLVNTKVTFATTTAMGDVSSNKEETSSKDTNKDLAIAWKADEGIKFDSEKKCTIKNIIFNDISEGNTHAVSVIGNTINEEQAVALPNSVEVDGTIYNVTSIGDKAFYCCEKLTGITIPDGVKSIGKNALYNCIGLTSVEIPNGVTSIEEEVFQGCRGLTNITIPKSVTSIGKHSFDGCWNLESIVLPDGVTSIGKGAFYSSGLKSINIPNTVTNIENYAFYNCRLTSIVLPNSVTSINEGTFYGSNLTSITIPEGVTSIGAQAFYGCKELKSLTIPDSVTSVGEKACGDSNITVIKASKETMDKLDIPEFNKVYFYDEDNSMILEAGYVKTYYSATGLIENPTKPGKTFKEWVNTDAESKSKFDDVRSETSFKATYEEAKTTWNAEKKCTIGNITFKDISEGDNNTVSVVGNTISEDTSVELPKSINVNGKDYRVTSIGENAFYNLAKLKGITIPDGVTSIGKSAFYNCELSSLIIPESVINIEEEAFDGCRGLKELTLSKGLKNIGNSAFNFCSGLTELKIPDTVESIGSSAFYGCSDLKNITIPDSVTSIGKYGFYGCSDLTSVEIPGSIKNIEEATFYNCGRLREVTLTNGLESIGKNAFYSCNGGDFVTLPDSIQRVEEDAFANSTLRRIKASKETMDRLDILGFNKVYFYDEDGTTMLGFGYVQQYMSAKCLADEPTKTGKTFKGWVNTDSESKSTFDTVVSETKFKASYTEDIKGKIESILEELKVDNNTTLDDIINQVKESTGIIVTISDFNKEEATENKEGYIEGNINAKESDGSAISVHFKNIIDKLSNNNDSELEDMIKETLDDMSVDNDTTEDDIVETVTQVTTGSAVKISVSDFKKKKATENKKGYIEGTINAEEKDGNIVSVCFKKMIDKLSNESGNSELENLIRETLDKMSINNDTTKGEILDTLTEVTTGSAVRVKISDFNKEKATKAKAGYIEGTVNAEDEDGNVIDVYFKKIVAKLSNSDSSGGSSHHSKKKSSKKDNSSSNKETTIKEQTGNGKTAEPSSKELELGSMLKTINDNKVTLTNSWGDKNLSGTISNVVNKDGKYEGSIITASESGIAKLSIGHDEIKDLKYIYQYDSVTKLFIKVPVEITVDGNNIELPVKKDQTYYIAKSPAADNAVLKEGWNTVNGSTYRVEGSELKTGWVLENNSWYYINDTSKVRVENNWNLINNKWYAFDEKGEMKTGWHYNNGNWYFLDTTTGDMKTGWKQQGDTWYNLESNGAMSTGWKKIDGSWYYFNSNGSMASNTVIDGYELGANGALTE